MAVRKHTRQKDGGPASTASGHIEMSVVTTTVGSTGPVPLDMP